VRVKDDQTRNPGHYLKRFYEKGSLCVEMWNKQDHTIRRIWKLMNRYWPRVEYPPEWKASKYSPDPNVDGRFKLTAKQRAEIMESPLSPSKLEQIYPVGERWIRRLKHGR